MGHSVSCNVNVDNIVKKEGVLENPEGLKG